MSSANVEPEDVPLGAAEENEWASYLATYGANMHTVSHNLLVGVRSVTWIDPNNGTCCSRRSRLMTAEEKAAAAAQSALYRYWVHEEVLTHD